MSAGRSSPSQPGARLVRGLLLALVLWSLLLRLGFASYDLHRGRFFDERYSLENLQHLLVPGSESESLKVPGAPSDASLWNRLRPANGWYPSLSYLPQVPVLAASRGLHHLTGHPRFAVFEGEATPTATPTAYLLCRATVAVFGALTLLLVYLVGRRLFGPQRGPAIGLLAALILSASPAHLRQSAMFKPDMLLTLCTLGVFLLTLRLLSLDGKHPTWRRWMAVGTAVGLATASKLNGAFTSLLPVFVTGLLVWDSAKARAEARDKEPDAALRTVGRPLVGLALAGLVSVTVYLALNPFVGVQLEYLDRNLRIYGERAELAQLDRPAAVAEAAQHLVSTGFHGRVLGWIALVGLVGLGVRGWRALRSPPNPLHGREGKLSPERLWSLVPLWVVGYGLLYTGTAAFPKPNNLLPLLPFTSLAAAWVMVEAARAGWRLVVGRWPVLAAPAWLGGPERASRVWGAVLVLVAVLVLWVPLHVYAYQTAVPSTRDLVVRELTAALQPFAGRTLLFEGPLPEGMVLPELLTRRDAVAVRHVPDGEEPAREALADAVVSLARGASALEEKDPALRRIGPELGRAWGPTWELRLHPWKLEQRQRHWAKEGTERWVLPMPERSKQDAEELWLSVQILIRDPEPPSVPPRLEVGTQEIPLHATRVETGGYVYGTAYTSVRFRWRVGAVVVVELAGAMEWARVPVVDVLDWH